MFTMRVRPGAGGWRGSVCRPKPKSLVNISSWPALFLIGRHALPPGGQSRTTLRVGSVCPQAGVITRSCTDVHSLVLPCPARKQLPARATRRCWPGS